ncbi:polysaccharide deacetylase family protein [Methylomarinum vadi]|uniref:polysaccharide deacetylase family protein n=1 Tax=Methylomarinum vadi TaxID=438855 RepID=UPI000A037763|nr:polysaccharide deacetylase family protein [Methylomarinum vadi]
MYSHCKLKNMKGIACTVNTYCILLLIALISGCAKHLPQPEQPIDFQFVTVKTGDSLQSLARQYTGNADLAWRIEEFNGVQQALAGQEIIIPLKPFRPGGMTANGYQLVPVLSYHNFSRGPSSNKLTVSAKDFREQLHYLKEHNYHVITMDQLIEFLDYGQVPERSVLISLDDGWISSYEIAYPLLREFGFNASLFIPTDFINSGSNRAVSWAQLKEMVSDSIIDIQCHSKSHRDLSTINGNESFAEYIRAVNQDVTKSKQIIYEKLGKRVTALAYPFGNTNPLVMALLRLQGYKTAFTVNRQGNPFYLQSLKLNRSMIYGTFSLGQFIKNLDYFKQVDIAPSEPVDTLTPLAKITAQTPQHFENNNQWRSALLAWKLRRDKLLSRLNQINPNDQNAESELLNLKQSIAEAKRKVLELTIKLNDISKQSYLAAIKNMHDDSARGLLLQTLLFNPENKAPIELFQTNMGKNRPLLYQVKASDSFASIASQIYQDPEKAILVPLFNNNVTDEADLSEGMKLTLPSIPVEIKIKPSISRKDCHITLTKDPKAMADDFYAIAIEHFNNDKISEAIENLESALCLNPNHTQAREMLEMLRDL